MLQVIWNLHPRCFETGKFLQWVGSFFSNISLGSVLMPKNIYTLNGCFPNITEVIKGWQLLNHKILPVSPWNDQHLAVGGQDWLEKHNWINSHVKGPSLLNCRGAYFDSWSCPVVSGPDAFSSSSGQLLMWPYKVWSRCCSQGIPFSLRQLRKISIWEPHPQGKWLGEDRQQLTDTIFVPS